MQPVAADDVAATLADVALASPANGVIELAGPEKMSIADFVGRFLAKGDQRKVVGDPEALYSGAKLDSRGIAPGANPRIGPTQFVAWFRHFMQ
jgi:uncharacterized protein YbjT (DUF2867 family)